MDSADSTAAFGNSLHSPKAGPYKRVRSCLCSCCSCDVSENIRPDIATDRLSGRTRKISAHRLPRFPDDGGTPRRTLRLHHRGRSDPCDLLTLPCRGGLDNRRRPKFATASCRSSPALLPARAATAESRNPIESFAD